MVLKILLLYFKILHQYYYYYYILNSFVFSTNLAILATMVFFSTVFVLDFLDYYQN
jgi:hypothetical protein